MGNTTIIILQIATGAGLLIFWALFFTVGLAPKNAPDRELCALLTTQSGMLTPW